VNNYCRRERKREREQENNEEQGWRVMEEEERTINFGGGVERVGV
jgi:hypothetical protein